MTTGTPSLHIGVSDYTVYAASGAENLPGAVPDARAWQVLLARKFNVSAERQTVLVEPSDTTHAAIEAALVRLGEQMGTQPELGGFLSYSGHGLTVSEEGEGAEGLSLAIAPSDITVDLHNAMTFAKMEEAVSKGIALALFGTDTARTREQQNKVERVMNSLTVVLDACYSRAPGRTRALGSGIPDGATPKRVFARLLLACNLWESAYEIRVDGGWRGAFSYTMIALLEKWSAGYIGDSAVLCSAAPYGPLMADCRQILSVFGIGDQTPTLLGTPFNLALLPFLRPGTRVEKGWTTSSPDGHRLGEQFSAGTNGIITVSFNPGGAGTLLMLVLTGSSPAGFYKSKLAANTEFWGWDPAVAKNSPSTFNVDWDICVTVHPSWPTSAVPQIEQYLTMQSYSGGTLSSPAYTSMGATFPTGGGSFVSGVYGNMTNNPWAIQLEWDPSDGTPKGGTVFSSSGQRPVPVNQPEQAFATLSGKDQPGGWQQTPINVFG